jgi:hypothetical protein
MRQEDYLLREIEKIGLLFGWISDKITGNAGNYALTIDNQFKEAKELLLSEMGFDTDLFLSLGESEIPQYIAKYKGMNVHNIELLADIFKGMGMQTVSALAKEYLNRALKLYELCNSLDKTFSFDRESKISETENAL